MSLFNRHVTFKKIDPLGDGLAEEIAAEKNEPDAIILEEGADEQLVEQWEAVVKDIEKDPKWFKFADGE
jgi:hypothetical protein